MRRLRLIWVTRAGACLMSYVKASSTVKRTLSRLWIAVITAARRLTEKPLLVRLDSGHDAMDTRVWLSQAQVDHIVKWNPRKQDREAWLAIAEQDRSLDDAPRR